VRGIARYKIAFGRAQNPGSPDLADDTHMEASLSEGYTTLAYGAEVRAREKQKRSSGDHGEDGGEGIASN
jgi:hypothetical protein